MPEQQQLDQNPVLENRWYALYCIAHHERKVARYLDLQDVEVFLPQYETFSTRTDRVKTIRLPFFPGYLFVHVAMDSGIRIKLLRPPSVVSIVGKGTKPAPLQDSEIDSIKILASGACDVQLHDWVVEGRLVRIMEGPLRGVLGRIKSGTPDRVVVSLPLLGRSVSAAMRSSSVRPACEEELNETTNGEVEDVIDAKMSP